MIGRYKRTRYSVMYKGRTVTVPFLSPVLVAMAAASFLILVAPAHAQTPTATVTQTSTKTNSPTPATNLVVSSASGVAGETGITVTVSTTSPLTSPSGPP